MLTCTAIQVGLLGLVSAGQPAPVVPEHRSLDELVPGPCLLYVSVDAAAMMDGLAQTPLKQAWEDSGLADDWTRALELASEAVTEELVESDFEYDDFAWMLGGEVAFFVGTLDTERDDAGKVELPAMALLADAGEHVSELESFMRKWVDVVRAEGDPVTEEEFRGVTLYVVREADPDAPGPDDLFREPTEMCFGQVGSIFMVTFDEAVGREIVLAATGEDRAVLAEDSDYRLVRERTGKPEPMSFYVDVENVMETVRTVLGDDVENTVFDDVVRVLGVSELRSLGGGYAIRESGVWSEMFAHNPGPQQGLMWDVMGASGPTAPPDFLPPDVDAFQLLHVDFASLWDNVTRLMEIVGAADPSVPDDPVGMAEAMLGVSFGDLFGSMEGEVTFFSRTPEPTEPDDQDPLGAMAQSMSLGVETLDFVMRLREQDTLEQTLVKLEELATAGDPSGWPFVQSEYLGRIVHNLKPELVADLPVAPCFTITDNLLAFATTTESLQSVVRRLGVEGRGVAATSGYERASEHLPPTASYVSYTSAEAVAKAVSQMEMMIGMVGVMAPVGQSEELGLALEMIPKLRALVDTFDAGVGYARASSEGCAFTSGWLFAEQAD